MSSTTRTKDAWRGTVAVNGADLYCEVRGEGPAVLLIPGATGDADHFALVAPLLADQFTVVTYDRRGNSRSSAATTAGPAWMDEQADDAAALLDALGLAPAAVFGTSGGAVIALHVLVRRPDVVRGAIVHEPPLLGVLANGTEVSAQLQAMAEEGMAGGGPRAAMELFIRANASDAVFEGFHPEMRERLLGNAEVFFGREVEPFVSYLPDAAVPGARVPTVVVAGVENRGVYYHEAAMWVAGLFGVPLQEVPGAHVPYMDRPGELAEALRPLLHAMG